jgi:hypothetical protein
MSNIYPQVLCLRIISEQYLIIKKYKERRRSFITSRDNERGPMSGKVPGLMMFWWRTSPMSSRSRGGASTWGHSWGLTTGKKSLEAGHYCLPTYVTCTLHLLAINRYLLIFIGLEPGPRTGMGVGSSLKRYSSYQK